MAKRFYQPGDEPVPGYRLVRMLGRGQFGEVWLARGQGVEVALKIIALDKRHNEKEVRAMRLLRGIRHPNLVPILGIWLKDAANTILDDGNFDALDGRGSDLVLPPTRGTAVAGAGTRTPRAVELFIAMGLGEKSLFDRLEECQAAGLEGIPHDELLDYMDGAARAIDFLNTPQHNLGRDEPVGIQHCDIKPQNIMIVGNAVQVCDFGLARVRGDVRATLGAASPAYAPAELLIDNNPSEYTDQYSLAISYYELRTGRLPFPDGASRADVQDAHQSGRLDFSGLLDDERKVIRRATALDPSQRFASSREMVNALRRGLTTATGVLPAYEKSEPLPGEQPFEPGPGKEILGYKLRQRIPGTGGRTSQLWEAVSSAGGVTRALMIRDLTGTRETVDARALTLIQGLRHASLVELLDFQFLDARVRVVPPEIVESGSGPQPTTLILTSKLFKKTLFTRLEECRQFGQNGIPPQELLGYMRQVAEAVDALNAPVHSYGSQRVSIIHGNLRPNNILLHKGQAMLGNVGRARLLDGVSGPLPESARNLELPFAAPENANGRVTRWSDQYSLAVCYVQLRTGGSAFDAAASTRKLLEDQLANRVHLEALHQAEAAVIAKALCSQPEQRFPTCLALVEALQKAIASLPPGELSVPRAPSSQEPDDDRTTAPTPTPAENARETELAVGPLPAQTSEPAAPLSPRRSTQGEIPTSAEPKPAPVPPLASPAPLVREPRVVPLEARKSQAAKSGPTQQPAAAEPAAPPKPPGRKTEPLTPHTTEIFPREAAASPAMGASVVEEPAAPEVDEPVEDVTRLLDDVLPERASRVADALHGTDPERATIVTQPIDVGLHDVEGPSSRWFKVLLVGLALGLMVGVLFAIPTTRGKLLALLNPTEKQQQGTEETTDPDNKHGGDTDKGQGDKQGNADKDGEVKHHDDAKDQQKTPPVSPNLRERVVAILDEAERLLLGNDRSPEVLDKCAEVSSLLSKTTDFADLKQRLGLDKARALARLGQWVQVRDELKNVPKTPTLDKTSQAIVSLLGALAIEDLAKVDQQAVVLQRLTDLQGTGGQIESDDSKYGWERGEVRKLRADLAEAMVKSAWESTPSSNQQRTVLGNLDSFRKNVLPKLEPSIRSTVDADLEAWHDCYLVLAEGNGNLEKLLGATSAAGRRANEMSPEWLALLGARFVAVATEKSPRTVAERLKVVHAMTGALREVKANPRVVEHYLDLRVEQLALQVDLDMPPDWKALLAESQTTDDECEAQGGHDRRALVKSCLAECLLMQPAPRDPEAPRKAKKLLDEAARLKSAEANLAYVSYLQAIALDEESRHKPDVRTLAEHLAVVEGAVSPTPTAAWLARAERKQRLLDLFVLGARRERSSPGGSVLDELKSPPFRDPATADRVHGWLEAASKLAASDAQRPQDLTVYLCLAAFYKTEPDKLQASKLSARVMKLLPADDPDRIHLLWVHAETHAELRDKAEQLAALASYQELLAMQDGTSLATDENVNAWYDLVVSSASKLARKILASKPHTPSEQKLLAGIFSTQGFYLRRYQHSQWRVGDDGKPRDVAAINGLAHEAFDTAIGLDPDVARNYAGRGSASLMLRGADLQQALKDGQTATTKDPQLAEGYGLLTNVHILKSRKEAGFDERTSELDLAIEAGKNALDNCQLDKEKAEYLMLLATAHVEKANFTVDASYQKQKTLLLAATDYAKQATEIKDRDYPHLAYMAMGNALEDLAWLIGQVEPEMLNKYDEAIEAFSEAVLAREQTAEPFLARARCSYKRAAESFQGAKYLEAAESDVRRALELNAEFAEAQYLLGMVQLYRAQYADAQQSVTTAYKKALEQKRTDELPTYAYARVIVAKVYAQSVADQAPKAEEFSEQLALARELAEGLIQEGGMPSPTFDLSKEATCTLAETYLVESLAKGINPPDESRQAMRKLAFETFARGLGTDDLSQVKATDVSLLTQRAYARLLLRVDTHLALQDALRAAELAMKPQDRARALGFAATARKMLIVPSNTTAQQRNTAYDLIAKELRQARGLAPAGHPDRPGWKSLLMEALRDQLRRAAANSEAQRRLQTEIDQVTKGP